jgi:hypothetical protein
MDVATSRTLSAPGLDYGTRGTHRRTLALGLGMILCLVGPGCGSSGRLGTNALLQQSMSLRSQAAEGALLAQDAVAGDTTRIFIREHASDLSTAASQIEASLRTANIEPALEPKRSQLANLARDITADLERLGSASEDEDRVLAGDLSAAAEASQRIGEGLA